MDFKKGFIVRLYNADSLEIREFSVPNHRLLSRRINELLKLSNSKTTGNYILENGILCVEIRYEN